MGWPGLTDKCLFFTTFSIQTVLFCKYANELSDKPLQKGLLFMFLLVRFTIFRCHFLAFISQPSYF